MCSIHSLQRLVSTGDLRQTANGAIPTAIDGLNIQIRDSPQIDSLIVIARTISCWRTGVSVR